MFRIAMIAADLVHACARLSGSVEGLLLGHAILVIAMFTERHIGRTCGAFVEASR